MVAVEPFGFEELVVVSDEGAKFEESLLFDPNEDGGYNEEWKDEKSDGKDAIANHHKLQGGKSRALVGDGVGGFTGDDGAASKDDGTESDLTFGEEAEAGGEVRVGGNEMEIDAGHAPEKEGPKDHAPSPTEHEETEERRTEGLEPPASEAECGGAGTEEMPIGEATHEEFAFANED